MTLGDSPKPALRAENLYRFFHAGDDEAQALRGISLEVNAGEVLAIVGPSGSGKSTLVACFAGLDDPDGGSVHVCGVRMSRQPETLRSALRARHIGIVYQSRNLFDHLTVAQNIALARRLLPSGTRPATPVRELLAELGIEKCRDAFVHQLSGGETARAALAVALANDPEVLIADEPTGELDRETESGVLRLIEDRAQHGVAVILASHSDAVRARAHRVLRLEAGREVA